LGTTAQLECTICPWSVPWCDRWDEVELGGPMQALEVSAQDPFTLGCAITIAGFDGTMIIDDLELDFDPPPDTAAVPATGPIGVVALAGLVALAAVALLRRTSGAA
jgi:hypothetical protein